MVLTLYNCGDPTIKVNKTIGGGTIISNATPNPNGPIDVINPSFIVDAGDVPSTANYLVAGAPLNRRYFITDITYNTAKTAVISCHVDVLSTYADRINNTTLNYLRGVDNVNEIEDTSYPLSDYLITPSEHYFFSDWDGNFLNSENGRRYILRVIAGAARSNRIVQLSIGDNFVFRGKYMYVLTGTAANADCEYVNETTQTLPGIKQNDIIKIDSYKYKFRINEDSPYSGWLDPI